MKHFATTLVLLTLFAAAGFSQTKKMIAPTATPLFTSYPTTISCKEAELNTIFKSLSGQNINVTLSGKQVFTGTVVNNIAKHKNLQYIAIKLPALNNAVLSLSKRVDENNKSFYIGHIISPKNSDSYELKKMADGTYEFTKMDLEKLLPACSPA